MAHNITLFVYCSFLSEKYNFQRIIENRRKEYAKSINLMAVENRL